MGGCTGSCNPSVRFVAQSKPTGALLSLFITKNYLQSREDRHTPLSQFYIKIRQNLHTNYFALNVHAGSHELWNVAQLRNARVFQSFIIQSTKPVFQFLVDLGRLERNGRYGRLTTAFTGVQMSFSTLKPRT